MSLDTLMLIYALLLGLVVGSYLNVVIHRVPRGISTVTPRSRCPSCGAAIRLMDNLPVVSYLLLGGRCRHCGTRISWRYPAVEAASGLSFVACFVQFGIGVPALAAATFCSALIALAAIDLEHYILPDRITLPGTAVALLLHARDHFLGGDSWMPPGAGLLSALLGTALGAGLLLAVIGGWYLLRREEGMGLGDVKMLAMIGAFLGVEGMLVTLFLAFFAGAAVGLALLARGRGGLKTRLPFGAFLAPAAIVSVFVGRPLADLYLGLL